jgi:adenylate cyclase
MTVPASQPDERADGPDETADRPGVARTREDEERWRKLLTEGHRPLALTRRFFRVVPSPPRCKVCANPFGGVGGRLCSLAGFRRSRKNPNLCTRCCDMLPPGGAEVDTAVLFADVRGSTQLGQHAKASDFAELLNRFYGAATRVLLRHDAVIDKMIGDEVMALFVPGICGPEYRRRAVEAAVDVVRSVGYGSAAGPWLTVGAAVNAGPAYVGNVGSEGVMDFTALGDPVNVAARLQGQAAGGEVIVAGGLEHELPPTVTGARRQTFELRGHEEIAALVLSV